jgi:hypothetical protein
VIPRAKFSRVDDISAAAIRQISGTLHGGVLRVVRTSSSSATPTRGRATTDRLGLDATVVHPTINSLRNSSRDSPGSSSTRRSPTACPRGRSSAPQGVQAHWVTYFRRIEEFLPSSTRWGARPRKLPGGRALCRRPARHPLASRPRNSGAVRCDGAHAVREKWSEIPHLPRPVIIHVGSGPKDPDWLGPVDDTHPEYVADECTWW